MRVLSLIPLLFFVACSSDSTTPNNGALNDGGMGDVKKDQNTQKDTSDAKDLGVKNDVSSDAGSSDMPLVDMGPPENWPTGRGWEWTRKNQPFISSLVVFMDPVPQNEVDKYYNDFGATAGHLWQFAAPVRLDDWRAKSNDKPWLAWTTFDGKSQNEQIIGGYPANVPGRIGWQVGDEPRTQADWSEMITGMEDVRAADPDGLIVANFSFLADDITRFLTESCGTEMDVLSYDRYTRKHSSYETLAQIRDASIKCGMPYWRYMNSYNDIANPREEFTESDMRWDAMTGVVYGFSGHTWFLYKIGSADAANVPSSLFTDSRAWNSGSTTDQYDHAKKINGELLAYGKAINHLVSNDVRLVPSLIPIDGLPAWTVNAGGDPYLTEVQSEDDVVLGFFQDINRDYYVVALNPYHTNGQFPTKGDKAINVIFDFDFSATKGIDEKRVKVLDKTGTIGELPIIGGKLSATIPAGSILFFKYDSGRPFAGY